jgi:hypothetical protein
MTDATIVLNQKDHTVSVSKLTCDDSLVFELFDDTPAGEREDMLAAVLHIGALAMLEDRIQHLITATEKELFPKLEGLKRMFERRKLEFETTAQKGDKAEVDIVETLNEYIQANGWADLATGSGTMKGALPRNKTGDVLCVLEFNQETQEGQTQLGIEVKLDKSVALGDPRVEGIFKAGESSAGGLKKSSFDTAWSQLLETRANRECPLSLIVFDRQVAHKTILDKVDDVAFLPGVPGFLVVVDSQAGDFRNLFIAYRIARELALYYGQEEGAIDVHVLELMIGRIIYYLGSAQKVCDLVKKNTQATVKMNREVQKEMSKLVHLANFTQDYLSRFLEQKTLSAKDLTEFYYAADAKLSWKADCEALESEIKAWGE